ncbi:MAG: LytTR family transcriptional regulator DNA-binding domain-containing protein [Clostridiales bacterium]|nr:LytTR family transcriptional regulator DNA-binding domain-containing protein [Clostridiales bacterium]
MNVLLYTEKSDYIKVIELLCRDIHHDIKVSHITECQLANEAVSRSLNIIILDDHLYKTLTEACIDALIKSQIRVIVFLPKKINIKRYLAFNLLDYFCSPLNWEDIDDCLRHEYRKYLMLKQVGPNDDRSNKLVVKTGTEIVVIKFSEILFFEKKQKSTIIHTHDEIYECHENLKHLLMRLPDSFFRVHSSFIVNFNNARTITDIGNRTYQITFGKEDVYAIMSRKRSEDILQHALDHYRMSFIEEKRG